MPRSVGPHPVAAPDTVSPQLRCRCDPVGMSWGTAAAAARWGHDLGRNRHPVCLCRPVSRPWSWRSHEGTPPRGGHWVTATRTPLMQTREGLEGTSAAGGVLPAAKSSHTAGFADACTEAGRSHHRASAGENDAIDRPSAKPQVTTALYPVRRRRGAGGRHRRSGAAWLRERGNSHPQQETWPTPARRRNLESRSRSGGSGGHQDARHTRGRWRASP